MSVYHSIIGQMDQGALLLLTIVSGPETGQKMTRQTEHCWYEDPALRAFWQEALGELQTDRIPYRFTVAGKDIFAERLIQEPELVICGGGHVSLELAAMAEYLEYPFVVIDDRQEFCSPERFPGAKECICMPFEEALTNRSYSGNAYYVIVTRGHMHDLDSLDLILQKPYGYVGMIGSRAKVKKAMDELRSRGYRQEVLDQVHSPIGLSIGAQTPKELAISIIGEIIGHKYQELPSSYLESDVREALGGDSPLVLARIIDKRGSAPRGIGSRMVVDRNGIVAGTVGGGRVEFEAELLAKELAVQGQSTVKTYRLNNDTAAALGMWCGGEVDILFEVINN